MTKEYCCVFDHDFLMWISSLETTSIIKSNNKNYKICKIAFMNGLFLLMISKFAVLLLQPEKFDIIISLPHSREKVPSVLSYNENIQHNLLDTTQ